MSTVVNDRDVLLQAAGTRLATVNLPTNVLVPAIKSVKITAPSQVFQVNTSGVATPTSILLTANLIQISGTVTWSVISGTATLTGSGNTRTLSYSNMSTDTVTIQASVTDSGTTYNDSFTIAKVRDGANGTNGSNGSNGARGSLAMTASGTSWSDTTANNTVTTVTGSSTKVFGDSVTISGTGFAQTKRWDGSAWVDPGQVFNGNMFVTGTITTDRLVANAATAASTSAQQANSVTSTSVATLSDTKNDLMTLTTTGAPVAVWINVMVNVQSTTAVDIFDIGVYYRIDSTSTAVSNKVTVKAVKRGGPIWEGRVTIPILVRHASGGLGNTNLSAAAHNFGFAVDASAFSETTLGSVVMASVSLVWTADGLAMENKV